ncbi:unnamed protein product, partial [Ilex paraguariensis]
FKKRSNFKRTTECKVMANTPPMPAPTINKVPSAPRQQPTPNNVARGAQCPPVAPTTILPLLATSSALAGAPIVNVLARAPVHPVPMLACQLVRLVAPLWHLPFPPCRDTDLTCIEHPRLQRVPYSSRNTMCPWRPTSPPFGKSGAHASRA